MDTDLVLRTLEDALNNREINSKLILHSDLGSQYTSKAYEKALKLNNIQHSFSRKGCPYDNAWIESFHAVFCKTFLHNNATNKYTTLQPEICL